MAPADASGSSRHGSTEASVLPLIASVSGGERMDGVMLASTVRVASAVVVVATGLAVGAWSVSFASSADGLSRAAMSVGTALLAIAAGWSLLIAGVIGTWRNPRLPGAPLLILAGMGWFVAEWSNPGAPVGESCSRSAC